MCRKPESTAVLWFDVDEDNRDGDDGDVGSGGGGVGGDGDDDDDDDTDNVNLNNVPECHADISKPRQVNK